MPHWTERTDALRAILEAENAETERRMRWTMLREIDRVGPATHKDRVLVNAHKGFRFRPQWWRLPRWYGSPQESFGLGRAATNKKHRFTRWQLRRRQSHL